MWSFTRREALGYALIAALIGGLIAASVPVVGAAVGDPVTAGESTKVDATTTLKGDSAATLRLSNFNPSAPALDLRVQDGPPLRVNSMNRVRNLNSDLVDGRSANQLTRMTFGQVNDAPDSVGDLVTADIIAPKPGYLVLSGSVDANGDDGIYQCRLTIDGSEVAGTRRQVQLSNPGGDHADSGEENCATDGARIVDAGPHTVALNIRTNRSSFFRAATVWAIYVPFNGSGMSPAP